MKGKIWSGAKDKMKRKQLNKNNELKTLFESIDEDKVDLFITRAKPMIRMINNAKFY